MGNKKQSLILGYVRRMRAIAEMATEMQNIEARFKREFGAEIKDNLVEGAAGAALAAMADRMRQQAEQEQGDVSEPTAEAAPQRGGTPRVVCGHRWESPSGNCEVHSCGVLPEHTVPHRCSECPAMSILNLNPAGAS